ncbi:MAG: glycosyltransferase family 4 protein [Chloroflexota bacterium]
MTASVLYTAFDVVPSPKGASTHIVHFLRGLVNGGYRVCLLTPGDGRLPAAEPLEGAQAVRIPPLEQGSFLAQALHYGEALQTHLEQTAAPGGPPPYDVVHFRSVWGGLQAVQCQPRLGYRTLFEVNGLPSIELKYHYPGLLGTGLLEKIKSWEQTTLLLSEQVVCPSEVTRAYLVSRGVPGERITVIPNGVNPKDFAPTPLPAPTGDPAVLLYIGTLADWQGLYDLLQAMPLILAQRPVRLRIVGRGRSRQRKALARAVRKLGLEGQVSLEPPVPHAQVPALVAQADLCVAPLGLNDRNITQGCCPIKVLEYMAAGRPLLASNLPVVRELAREDLDALLFSPGDPADLARQALRLLSDRPLAERLAASAAERAAARFTWHVAQKRLLKLYEQRLAARPAHHSRR